MAHPWNWVSHSFLQRHVRGKCKMGEVFLDHMCYTSGSYNRSVQDMRIKGGLSMRKVVAALFITLDGVVESPDKWQEHFDEDMGGAMMEQLASQDAVLLGRVTYQEWASYWPTATDDRLQASLTPLPSMFSR